MTEDCLSFVPCRPVIPHSGTPTEKIAEYLDQILKPLMKENRWTDVVGLYPSIPHKSVIETLRRRLKEREKSEKPTEDIGQMAEFVLINNFLSPMGEFAPP